MVQVSATRKAPSLVQGIRHSRCGAGFGTRTSSSPTVAEKSWSRLVGWTKTRFCEWISHEAFLPCGLTKFVGHASWLVVLPQTNTVYVLSDLECVGASPNCANRGRDVAVPETTASKGLLSPSGCCLRRLPTSKNGYFDRAYSAFELGRAPPHRVHVEPVCCAIDH